MTNVSVASLAGPVGDLARLDAEAEEDLVAVEERRRAALRVQGERALAGRGVVVLERVDELLDADGRGVGRLPSSTNRRAMAYEAVSTSSPKVDCGRASVGTNGLTPGSSNVTPSYGVPAAGPRRSPSYGSGVQP